MKSAKCPAFCAFHASVDFTDIGHVLFSVEPYQNVPGCSVAKPSPNGRLIDSTADVLSPELIETITDPDGDAWWILNNLLLLGAEIGDVCQNYKFSYASSSLNQKLYQIQPEYSNQDRACVYTSQTRFRVRCLHAQATMERAPRQGAHPFLTSAFRDI